MRGLAGRIDYLQMLAEKYPPKTPISYVIDQEMLEAEAEHHVEQVETPLGEQMGGGE